MWLLQHQQIHVSWQFFAPFFNAVCNSLYWDIVSLSSVCFSFSVVDGKEAFSAFLSRLKVSPEGQGFKQNNNTAPTIWIEYLLINWMITTIIKHSDSR